jgi:hypothetical protein
MSNQLYSLTTFPLSQEAKKMVTLQQLVSVIDLTKVRTNKEHCLGYALVRLFLTRLTLADIDHNPGERGRKIRKVVDMEAGRQAELELEQAMKVAVAKSVIKEFETVATPERHREDAPDGELPSILLRHKTLIRVNDTGSYGLEGEDYDDRYTAIEKSQSRFFDRPRDVEDEAVRYLFTSSPVQDYGAEPLHTASSPSSYDDVMD